MIGRLGRAKRPGIDGTDRVRKLGMSGRALSFGVMAKAYERFRPGYPVELFDMVMTYAGQPVRTALEIGAGTGKATRLFAQREVTVTATEPDGAMLAELLDHVPANVKTVRAAFEDLRPGESYGLVHAAAALHWTNPEGRWSRMAALLEPGGVFASFGGPVRWLTRLWRKLFARPGHRSWRATRFRLQMGRLPDMTCNGRVRSSNGLSGSPMFSSP
jgi:SAM-dependent methyltransferase